MHLPGLKRPATLLGDQLNPIEIWRLSHCLDDKHKERYEKISRNQKNYIRFVFNFRYIYLNMQNLRIYKNLIAYLIANITY